MKRTHVLAAAAATAALAATGIGAANAHAGTSLYRTYQVYNADNNQGLGNLLVYVEGGANIASFSFNGESGGTSDQGATIQWGNGAHWDNAGGSLHICNDASPCYYSTYFGTTFHMNVRVS